MTISGSRPERMKAVPRQKTDLVSNQMDRLGVRFRPLAYKTCHLIDLLGLLVILSADVFALAAIFFWKTWLFGTARRFQTETCAATICCQRQTVLSEAEAVVGRLAEALILVQPETVVRLYRAACKLDWIWVSRHRTRAGRKCLSRELRELIFCTIAENRVWCAP